MRKRLYNLIILITFYLVISLATSCKTKDEDNEIYYPQEFFICGNNYVAYYDFYIENQGNYSLGDIMGYLISAEDESNFIQDYPNVEYDVFGIIIGKKYDNKYDRVPVYALNEYPNRDIVCIYDISYPYVAQKN